MQGKSANFSTPVLSNQRDMQIVVLAESMPRVITLKESGIRKVEQGVTTVEEVLRVCLADD